MSPLGTAMKSDRPPVGASSAGFTYHEPDPAKSEVEVAADSRARRRIDLDRIGDGVVLSSSSSAVCRGVDQAVHFGGYGYPPWLYFEIRRQKWFTVEAVAVLRSGSRVSRSRALRAGKEGDAASCKCSCGVGATASEREIFSNTIPNNSNALTHHLGPGSPW